MTTHEVTKPQPSAHSASSSAPISSRQLVDTHYYIYLSLTHSHDDLSYYMHSTQSRLQLPPLLLASQFFIQLSPCFGIQLLKSSANIARPSSDIHPFLLSSFHHIIRYPFFLAFLTDPTHKNCGGQLKWGAETSRYIQYSSRM